MRGYLIGSGWKDYCKTGRVSGVALPKGLELAERAARADLHAEHQGGGGQARREHLDGRRRKLLGAQLARKVRDVPSQLYARATEHARERGIIIADTKFEFGLDADGNLRVDRRAADARLLALLARRHISARLIAAELRQAIRARLSRDARLGQDGSRPASARRVIERTRAKYYEALHRLADDARE